MVEGEGHLQAVDALLATQKICPGIVDQHVKVRIAGVEFPGQEADIGLRGEVSEQVIGSFAAGLLTNVFDGMLATSLVAANDDHYGAQAGQFKGGDGANARGSPGYQDCLGSEGLGFIQS